MSRRTWRGGRAVSKAIIVLLLISTWTFPTPQLTSIQFNRHLLSNYYMAGSGVELGHGPGKNAHRPLPLGGAVSGGSPEDGAPPLSFHKG